MKNKVMEHHQTVERTPGWYTTVWSTFTNF